VVVQQAAQAVALHSPLAHLGADDNTTAPRAGRPAALFGWKQLGLGGHDPQDQGFALESPALPVEPVEDPLALQTVLAGQGHGLPRP